MDKNKKIIIIILLILLASILTYIGYTLYNQNNITYQRIEIVPNATSIEIPTNNAKYLNNTNGVKFWNWSNGALITYNSQEGNNGISLSGALGFYAIKELVHTGESETINGFTIYKLSSNKLSDTIKSDTDKEFYCIHLTNDTTHDNIIICCENKEIALHMAKSIIYKENNNTNMNNTTNNIIKKTPTKETINNSKNIKNNSDELPISYYSQQHPEEEEDYYTDDAYYYEDDSDYSSDDVESDTYYY